MDMKTVTVYLGLGSNLGDKQENLGKAMDYISQRMRIEKKSSIYDTAPEADAKQPRYLNMVCQVTTSIPSNMLLFLTKGIEAKLGRLPGVPGGSRIIDIDILLYGNDVVDTPDLKIPHPRMTQREFVLAPLAEIAPDIVHPVTKKIIKELYESVRGKQGVNLTSFK
jgi:2-amino-4-hydroxy-6-hydroxymethyldihydropteridine diphosphokinase